MTIQFRVSTVSISKTVQFQIILECKYCLVVKNSSILNNSVHHKYAV